MKTLSPEHPYTKNAKESVDYLRYAISVFPSAPSRMDYYLNKMNAKGKHPNTKNVLEWVDYLRNKMNAEGK